MRALAPHAGPLLAATLALAGPALAPGIAVAGSPAPDERAVAEALAARVPWPVTAPDRAPADAATHRRAAHPLGVQTLAIETDERKADGPAVPRRLRVYQYDHTGARGRRLTLAAGAVDPATGTLERRALDTAPLPLNAVERAWVHERLASAAWLLEALAAERLERGLAPVGTGRAALEALDAKAVAHRPRASAGTAAGSVAADPCAAARCALVSLFDADGTVSRIEPVVRFADGVVTRRGGSDGGR